MSGSTMAAEGPFSVSELLKPHASKIALVVKQKAARSSLDDIEQILKNTNDLLFKTAKTVADPKRIENHVQKLIDASLEVRAVKNAYERTLNEASFVYNVSEGNKRHLLGAVFKEKQQSYARPPAESHEFWKKYQAALNGSGQSEEDVEVLQEEEAGETSTKFLCPITKTVMKVPVRHEPCGHTFDQSSIMPLLRQVGDSARGMKCPVRGCKTAITQSRLVVDDNLKYEIDEWNKQEEKKRNPSKKKKKSALDDDDAASARKSSKKKRTVEDDDDDVDED